MENNNEYNNMNFNITEPESNSLINSSNNLNHLRITDNDQQTNNDKNIVDNTIDNI